MAMMGIDGIKNSRTWAFDPMKGTIPNPGDNEEKAMARNFIINFSLKYDATRDWLSMENTGAKSPWHYSKVCTNDHQFVRYEIDMESALCADLVEHWRYTDHNENVCWVWVPVLDGFALVDGFTSWYDTFGMYEIFDVSWDDTDEQQIASYMWNEEATTK